MACVSSMPYLDLSHSQYLWPSATVDLRTLVASASARAEYKAQLQKQFESSQAFQKQLFLFCAQIVYHQQRAAQAGLLDARLPRPLLPPTSALCRSPPDASFITHNHHTFLVPPRPRLTSVLSPAPRDTTLPGPLRRPTPLKRAQAAPERLLKQALMNSARERAVAAESGVGGDERLGQSWVIVPGDDWELINS